MRSHSRSTGTVENSNREELGVLERGQADASIPDRCAAALPLLEAAHIREGRDDQQRAFEALATPRG
jgi:hypothetical protein